MTVARRPPPPRGLYDAPYWQHAAAGELRLQRCDGCGHHRYPPGPACPECLAPEHTWEPLSGDGRLLAWTVFHRQYFPEIPVPYVVVVVRTPEGPILIGNLVGAGPADLAHGMPLRAVFEEIAAPPTDPTAPGAPPEAWRICQWTPHPRPSHTEERS